MRGFILVFVVCMLVATVCSVWRNHRYEFNDPRWRKSTLTYLAYGGLFGAIADLVLMAILYFFGWIS